MRQFLADTAGKISVADVTQAANQRLQGSGLAELTNKAVGSIIHAIGYKTKRESTGYWVIR